MGKDIRFKETLKRGLKNGLHTYLLLGRIVFPVFIIIPVLKITPLFPFIEDLGRPLVLFMGLPGEAVLVLVSGYFFGLYTALPLLTLLSFSPKEITVLGIMLLTCHSLLIEGAILKRFHLSLLRMTFFRILISFAAGFLVAKLIL